MSKQTRSIRMPGILLVVVFLTLVVTVNIAHAEPESSRKEKEKEDDRKSLAEKSRWLSYDPFTLSSRGGRNNTTENSDEPETTSTELTRDSLIAPVQPRIGNSPLGVRPPIRIPYRPPLRSPYRPPWP